MNSKKINIKKISLLIAKRLFCLIIVFSSFGQLISSSKQDYGLSSKVAHAVKQTAAKAQAAANQAKAKLGQSPVQKRTCKALGAESVFIADNLGAADITEFSKPNQMLNRFSNWFWQYDKDIQRAVAELQKWQACLDPNVPCLGFNPHNAGYRAKYDRSFVQEKIGELKTKIAELVENKNRIVTLQEIFYNSLPYLGAAAAVALAGSVAYKGSVAYNMMTKDSSEDDKRKKSRPASQSELRVLSEEGRKEFQSTLTPEEIELHIADLPKNTQDFVQRLSPEMQIKFLTDTFYADRAVRGKSWAMRDLIRGKIEPGKMTKEDLAEWGLSDSSESKGEQQKLALEDDPNSWAYNFKKKSQTPEFIAWKEGRHEILRNFLGLSADEYERIRYKPWFTQWERDEGDAFFENSLALKQAPDNGVLQELADKSNANTLTTKESEEMGHLKRAWQNVNSSLKRLGLSSNGELVFADDKEI